MRKLALALVVLGSVVSAHAALNLNIDVAYQTVVRPGTGSIFVTFTGTVDVLLPTFDVSSAIIEWPGSSANDFLPGTFDAAFVTYATGNNPGVDYTGNLFKVEVTSSTPLGFYWLNTSPDGLSNLSEFLVRATDGTNTATDNEFFGVTVVPEPATFVAVGIGALVLLRRRSVRR
jgi:hypothetical protein